MPGGSHRGVLVHAAAGLPAVGVKTGREGQDGVVGLCGGDCRRLQGRQHALPHRVRRWIGGVVDHLRAAGQFSELSCIGGVCGDPLDQRVLWPRAAARHHQDALPALGEKAGNVRADRAGAEDDMLSHGWSSFLDSVSRSLVCHGGVADWAIRSVGLTS